jgi:uncharacterized protein
MLLKSRFFVALSVMLYSAPGFAQSPNNMMQIIGGFAQVVGAQAAMTEWRKLPQAQLVCIDSALRQQGMTVDVIARQGVGPADLRLNEIRAACTGAVTARQAPPKAIYYVANTQPPDDYLALRTMPSSRQGQRVATLPNGTQLQVMQQRADGWWYVKVLTTAQEGWVLSSQGNKVWIECCKTVVGVEPPDQSPARVVAPNFDCGKASTPRETTVCSSNELSELDHLYGQYWAQAKPLDKSGTAKKEIVRFYRAGEACNTSQDCIRANLINGIDYLATFLKGRGVQAASYAEIKEAQQRGAAEQQRIEVGQQQEKNGIEAEQERAAEQRAQVERDRQKESEELRLAIARAEAEKAKAEADKAKALAELEASKARSAAQVRAADAQTVSEKRISENRIVFSSSSPEIKTSNQAGWNYGVYLLAVVACGLGVLLYLFRRPVISALKRAWATSEGVVFIATNTDLRSGAELAVFFVAQLPVQLSGVFINWNLYSWLAKVGYRDQILVIGFWLFVAHSLISYLLFVWLRQLAISRGLMGAPQGLSKGPDVTAYLMVRALQFAFGFFVGRTLSGWLINAGLGGLAATYVMQGIYALLIPVEFLLFVLIRSRIVSLNAPERYAGQSSSVHEQSQWATLADSSQPAAIESSTTEHYKLAAQRSTKSALRMWGLGTFIVGAVGYFGGTIAFMVYSRSITSNSGSLFSSSMDGSLSTLAMFAEIANVAFYVGIIGGLLLFASLFVADAQATYAHIELAETKTPPVNADTKLARVQENSGEVSGPYDGLKVRKFGGIALVGGIAGYFVVGFTIWGYAKSVESDPWSAVRNAASIEDTISLLGFLSWIFIFVAVGGFCALVISFLVVAEQQRVKQRSN